MDSAAILISVEKAITTDKEREYFWTHEERYRIILEEIKNLTDARVVQEIPPGSQQNLVQLQSERNASMDTKNLFAKGSEDGSKFSLVTKRALRSVRNLGAVVRANADGAANYAPPRAEKLRVLDVGCFPYHLGAAMEMMGMEVWGIASGHEPIKNKKIAILNIEKDKFPYKDNYFDLVVFTEVLEHLPQSPLHALKEIYRVLMPQGKMVLTTPNIARSINRAKMILGKSVSYPLQQVLENDGTGSNIYHRHNREYTLPELSTLTSHAGFVVSEARHFISYTPTRRRAIPDNVLLKTGKFTNYALMLAIASLRDTLLIIGTKPLSRGFIKLPA